MKKLPECDRCQMYGRSQYLVCAIHPEGYQGKSCPDFAQIPVLKEESWSPTGFSFYNGELIAGEMGYLSRGDDLRSVVDHREWLLKKSPFVYWEMS